MHNWSRRVFLVSVLGIFVSSFMAGAAVPEKLPTMSYLDNGVIRVGVNLQMGGAITWLSKSGSQTNLINDYDRGREVQMSDYSGPVPYLPPGKQISPTWQTLGWNPVQAGDTFGHASRIIYFHHGKRSLVIRCIPMQWPLNNVPSRCTFETWLTLARNAVDVSCVQRTFRNNPTQYPAVRQEMPALYTSSQFYRLFTYCGDKPFTGAPVTCIDPASRIVQALHITPSGLPVLWADHSMMTENWAALVDKSSWGLGIWEPSSYSFAAAFFGHPGEGTSHSFATGYMSPRQVEIIDHNIRFAYHYVLIVGSVQTIRQYVYTHAHRMLSPVWNFNHSRRHWYYINAYDTGWPIKGRLKIALSQGAPEMIGPLTFWRASQNPVLYIKAKYINTHGYGRIFWRSFHAAGFSTGSSLTFPIHNDGQYHLYAIRLAEAKDYHGAMIQLRVDPVSAWRGRPGAWCAVRYIGFKPPNKQNHNVAGKELLNTMVGTIGGRDRGAIVLVQGDRIATRQKFRPPVRFVIKAETNSTNIRIMYATRIIFNWEEDPSDLRIDHGPTGSMNKSGAGLIPIHKWVTIGLLVLPHLLDISVNGRERFKVSANFSQVDAPLVIYQYALSTVKVKSVRAKEFK